MRLLLVPLLLFPLACDHVQPGHRTKELGAQAEKQAGRLAQKMTGALRKEAYDLRPNPSLGELGLQGTRAFRLKEPASAWGLTVYLVSEKPFAGTLELRALDEKQLEVGRSRSTLKLEAGGARYVDFFFDPRTPLDEIQAVEMRPVR